MKEWKEIIKSNGRYKDFVILESPAAFNKIFPGQDISCVQLHSIRVYDENEQDIVGFCGCFKWENNKVISLDGDSYLEDETVYGYSWFENENGRCLDIFVNW